MTDTTAGWRVGSLFTGIGGFDLAVESVGWEVGWQAEIDPACSFWLREHFPAVPNLGNVRQIEWDDSHWVEVLCGGFPCQPHSSAGLKKGAADERDLWPEFERSIRLLRPWYIVAENVPGLLTTDGGRFFRGVLRDLAALGYDAEWTHISCADVGAPHERDRVWIVAYPHGRRSERRGGSRELAGASGAGAGEARERERSGAPAHHRGPGVRGAAALADASSVRHGGGGEERDLREAEQRSGGALLPKSPGRGTVLGGSREAVADAERRDAQDRLLGSGVRAAAEGEGATGDAHRGGDDLGDTSSERLEEGRGSRARGSTRRPSRSGEGVVDASVLGRRQGKSESELRRRGGTVGGPSSGVGHAGGAQCEGGGEPGPAGGTRSSDARRELPRWDDAVPLRGADGVVRLIPLEAAEAGPESSLWPVADGLPGRVARLSGVGNAVSPVIPAFIFGLIQKREAQGIR